MKKTILKKWELAVLAGLIFSILLSVAGFDARCESIRGRVLRLHVLANSDSDADQALKLKVRDRLLETGDSIFTGAGSEKEAAELAKLHLPELQAAAEEVIRENDYSYPVRIEVGPSDFNTRVYDDFTLPAGRYEAVRVLIGEAKGKNWWCVMFPPVCLPAAEKTDELSEVLDSDQMNIVQNPEHYEIRFKTVEVYEEVKAKIQKLFQ